MAASVRAVHTVLLVDDEEAQIASFRRSFVREGKRVLAASRADKPDLAVVDLRIGPDWGIDVVRELKTDLPATEVVLVSGYLTTILKQVGEGVVPPNPKKEDLPTLARVEWEHLMRALAECGGNVSEAARRLGIKRQSLQRMLKKSVLGK